MTVTNEGLRIELMESANGTFFDSGSPKPNGDGRDILITLAEDLAKLPNNIYIEGHTDSKAYSENSNCTNWELSVDRANAARKIMQQHGLRADQVTQIRGYPAQSLRKPEDPLDSSNWWISLIVRCRIKALDEKSEEPASGDGESGEEKKPAAEGAAKR